jgi:GNAT superfamily N-acetyltransferase
MSIAPTFGSPSTVDPDRFRYEPFRETQKVHGFTCGQKPLDDFLTTAEVEEFEEEGLGRTFLVYCDGALIAYYTLSNAGLRIEYVTHVKSFSKVQELHVDSLPAVKIGRLAVAKEWQGRGVGRTLVARIAAEALVNGRRSGVRLLILEAKKESIPFYEKCGFVLTKETHRERNKMNRTMFLDLQALDGPG